MKKILTMSCVVGMLVASSAFAGENKWCMKKGETNKLVRQEGEIKTCLRTGGTIRNDKEKEAYLKTKTIN